jgi:hypothetical protein
MRFTRFLDHNKSDTKFDLRDKEGYAKAVIPSSVVQWIMEMDGGEWVDFNSPTYPNVKRVIRIKETQSMDITASNITLHFIKGDKLIPKE